MVWTSQYCQYAAERARLPRLEEPLESYSAQELERWVLLRRSADVGWKREGVKFTRIRWANKERVAVVCMVPGGRWLLVGGTCGSVTVYDLDASTPTGRLLIPPNAVGEQPVEHIAIDAGSEQQSSNLTFTLAVSPKFIRNSEPFRSLNIGKRLIYVSFLSSHTSHVAGHSQGARRRCTVNRQSHPFLSPDP
jgi:hypothetical protein